MSMLHEALLFFMKHSLQSVLSGPLTGLSQLTGLGAPSWYDTASTITKKVRFAMQDGKW